jgi:phasin family protein
MNNNFFQDMMKNFTNNSWLNNNQNSNFQMSDMMNKNTQMMSAVGQMAARNAQTLTQKNTEMVQNMSGNLMNLYKNSSNQTPEELMSKQQDLVKQSLQQVVSYSKDCLELGSKTVVELCDLVFNRVNETVGSYNFNQPQAASCSTGSAAMHTHSEIKKK